jgi:anti-sigma factor RsiW
MSQCELDKNNIIDFTDEEISPEDRQSMEDFMKKKAEQDRQELEERMKKKAKEDRLHYFSHFKKNREGKVKKIKDITFDTPPPEVPPNVSTSSSPSSFVTVNDLTIVMDSFCLSMIENMQNMVDKSLGKRVEGDDNVASGSKTVAPQAPSINASAARTVNPQFGMLLNYFVGQTPTPPSGQNRPVRPLGLTGQTDPGAMVHFPSSPESIVTIPPVQAASG